VRKIRILIVVASMVWLSILAAAPPAAGIVCHDQPGMCCEDVEILGKTIIPIDC
jgi:hypothetical protein